MSGSVSFANARARIVSTADAITLTRERFGRNALSTNWQFMWFDSATSTLIAELRDCCALGIIHIVQRLESGRVGRILNAGTGKIQEENKMPPRMGPPASVSSSSGKTRAHVITW